MYVFTSPASSHEEDATQGQFWSSCWVSKMVIPVYGVSEGKALCDWIY